MKRTIKSLQFLILSYIISLFLFAFIPISSATMDAEADYWTNFESGASKFDNCTFTATGWTQTNVTSWDGSNAKYFQSNASTGDAYITFNKPAGGAITDARGIYCEFKIPWNYSQNNVCMYFSMTGVGTFTGAFKVVATDSGYIYTYKGATSYYWTTGILSGDLGNTWHRLFLHFNNVTGIVTMAFDDIIIKQAYAPQDPFNPSNMRLYLQNAGKPGIMLDNIKIFKDQEFPIDDYMESYYSSFRIQYPPNNYDFVYTPLLHADQGTYNDSVPIYNFFDSKNILVTPTYSVNDSTSADTLQHNATFRNFAISKEPLHGLYTHSLLGGSGVDHIGVFNRSDVIEYLAAWKSLVGSYPKIWVDHATIQVNFAKNGSNASSQYYINDLRNSTSMFYAWPFLPGGIGTPSGFTISKRNSLKSWEDGNKTSVFSYHGMNNLFQSGNTIMTTGWNIAISTYPWDYYASILANQKGLDVEHAYHTNFVYKDVGGTKYTRYSPTPTGYSAYPGGWTNWHNDSTSPWTFIPELSTHWNNITSSYSVYSERLDHLLDRVVVYNETTIYKTGDTIYVDTPSILYNVTVYTRANESGKALLKSGIYYPFTKSYTAWGATIPSNNGNVSYTLVDFNYTFTDNNQIGRLEYKSDSEYTVYFKRSGNLTMQLKTTPFPGTVTVTNKTSGGSQSSTLSGDNLTFYGATHTEYDVSISGSGATREITTGFTYYPGNNTIKIDSAQTLAGDDTVYVDYYGQGHGSISKVAAYALIVFAIIAMIPLVYVGGLMLKSLGYMGGKGKV